MGHLVCFFFSSRRRHTRWPRDWSSDVCSSDLARGANRGNSVRIRLDRDRGGRTEEFQRSARARKCREREEKESDCRRTREQNECEQDLLQALSRVSGSVDSRNALDERQAENLLRPASAISLQSGVTPKDSVSRYRSGSRS